MQQLTKQTYFYYIAFMLMASTFLPLVFNNLPPIIRSHHLWTVIWIISLVFFKSNIFLNKTIQYVIFYGIFTFCLRNTIWSNMDAWNSRSIFQEFYEIAIGLSVYVYFIQSNDFIGLAKITKWAFVFIIITAIMTIISSSIDPMYARNLTSIGNVTNESEKDVILSFKHYGGGTYSTAGAFMCLFPILFFYYKNNQQSLISKNLIVVFSIIIFFALLGMQIFSNIMISVIFGVIALSGMKKLKQSVFVIAVCITILLSIPKDFYINGLMSISSNFKEDSELNYKFKDFAVFLETGASIEENKTGAGSRIERYPMLLEVFTKNPLIGCYFFSDESGNGYKGEGAHLYWMNKLTITGIIGFLLFFYIHFTFLKSNLQRFVGAYKFYYLLASLSILSYGLIKAIAGRDTWYVFFIIIPGLYYLPLLKNKIKTEDN